MRYEKVFLEQLDPTTATLIGRAGHLLEENAEKNLVANAFIKAIDYVYAQQLWVAYAGIYSDTMWALLRCDGKYLKRLVQYSNDFIRFSKEQWQETVEQSGRFALRTIAAFGGGYGYIYNFYVNYFQISEEKINELFTLFEHGFYTYPNSRAEYNFMFASMCWAIEQRNEKRTAECLHRVLALERNNYACYVCNNWKIVQALNLTGRTEEALHRIAEIISDGGIPESWYDEFRHCEHATGKEQYNALIRGVFWLRKPDLLQQFAVDYHQYLLSESEDDICWDSDLLVLASLREAEHKRTIYLEKEIAETFDQLAEETPQNQLQFFLSAWAYLEMLCQQGEKTVTLMLKKPPIAQQDDSYNTHDMATYFLKKADVLGAKFDASRPGFDYASLRKTALSLQS